MWWRASAGALRTGARRQHAHAMTAQVRAPLPPMAPPARAPVGELGGSGVAVRREKEGRLTGQHHEGSTAVSTLVTPQEVATLQEIEARANWLACLAIHEANNVRVKRDGLKVGGHQASSASLATVLVALYARVLRPQDRVAVKPHASPIYHAIQYLMGRQTAENMQRFRALGGMQAYPSRTKDLPEVDFSTGSVGMGAGITTFAALTESYLRAHELAPKPWPGTTAAPSAPGRMIALLGDAELDEGNVFEALRESWKLEVANNWVVIDYNRQSLDKNIEESSFRVAERMFRLAGWDVVTLKWGKRLLRAFDKPGGAVLRRWINECGNGEFSALTFRCGSAWREALLADAERLGYGDDVHHFRALVESHDDEQLHALMTDLGGHCFETLLEAFDFASRTDRRTVFIAYTTKGHGLPLAGHRDNHGLFLSPEQMEAMRARLGLPAGGGDAAAEWAPFARMADETAAREMMARAPINSVPTRVHPPERIALPEDLAPAVGGGPAHVSTQAAFGAVLKALANGESELADRIVTTSPDVTTTTGLSGFVNKRGVFATTAVRDRFKQARVHSLSNWTTKASGQHIELGIAENNMLLLLGALGLSTELFGHRLFPIGTLYDPFVSRALDSLNYACYMDARFMLVGTPSGISLAPEGGAHQSIGTPLIGMSTPNLLTYEPAYADEVKVCMRHGFELMQTAAQDGGSSVYLRLTTRGVDQPERDLAADARLSKHVLKGAYWHVEPSAQTKSVIVFAGAVAPEAVAAQRAAGAETALLQVTSYDALYRGWHADGDASFACALLAGVPRPATLVTVLDGHPSTLAWIGGVRGHRVHSLGVCDFGQSGDIIDLYAHHGIDAEAIVAACRRVNAAAE